MKRVPVVRLALAVLGLAVLVDGAVVAWRAHASTTLLIIGVVLILAAFVGDWETLALGWGDWSLKLDRKRAQRQQEELLDELKPLADSVPTEREVTDSDVAVVRGEEGEREGRVEETAQSEWPTASADLMAAIRRRLAASHVYEDDRVRLRLRYTPAVPSSTSGVLCFVTPPGGRPAYIVLPLQVNAERGSLVFEASFPQNVLGLSPALAEGRYSVRWRTVDGENLGVDEFVWPQEPEGWAEGEYVPHAQSRSPLREKCA